MPSKAQRTAQFIIEKAAPLFNTRGYAGTSMNDITRATGLTKGAIYGNFDNKEEIAIAAFNPTCVSRDRQPDPRMTQRAFAAITSDAFCSNNLGFRGVY